MSLQQQERHVAGDKAVDARHLAAERPVKAPEPVTRQGICVALQHYSSGAVPLHDAGHDRLKDGRVRVVVDAVLERKVDGVGATAPDADVGNSAGAWKIVAKLVKGSRHNPVRRIKGLLYPIAVVNVNIHVQYTRVRLEELEDGQHAVINVAKARRLRFLSVVQAARPVEGDFGSARVEARRGSKGAARGNLAKVPQSVKDGTVIQYVDWKTRNDADVTRATMRK